MPENDLTLADQLAAQRKFLERRFTYRLTAILEAMENRFGPEAVTVLDDLVAQGTRAQWAEIARQSAGRSIEDLIRLLWEPLRDEGFEFTMERSENGYQMHCIACPYVNQAKETGTTKWAYHMYCGSDPAIVEGFNPQIGFRRTKTLMEGADCCDHFYFMKE